MRDRILTATGSARSSWAAGENVTRMDAPYRDVAFLPMRARAAANVDSAGTPGPLSAPCRMSARSASSLAARSFSRSSSTRGPSRKLMGGFADDAVSFAQVFRGFGALSVR